MAKRKQMPIKQREAQRVAAHTVLNALSARHTKDIFVPECKTGRTWGGTMFKLDAWACRRSYTKPNTFGYEIKVHRGDFLQDDKWHVYLDYCNEFYFACPKGVIEPDELPKEAGLLYISSTGTRLYTKKKAPRRTVETPEDLYRYILFSRATIGRERDETRVFNNVEYWKNWLKQKNEKKDLGYRVSRGIRELVAEKVDKVECEMRILKNQHSRYESVIKLLERLGIDPEKYIMTHQLEDKLKLLHDKVPGWLKDNLGRTIKELQNFSSMLDKMATGEY